MSNKNKLPITEELDFHYLLALLPPLYDIPEFQWLPELFSCIGHEKLIKLCKYAGGETIRIPTLDELSDSIDALQNFYDAEILNRKINHHLTPKGKELYKRIKGVYDATDNKE